MKKFQWMIIPLIGVCLSYGQGLKGNGKYGAAGCGLGSMVFQDQPGPIQILAATTNDAIFPQTSAITSGTSNCIADGVTLNNKEREFFAESNYESLITEMAQGNGENVLAFASLYGCSSDNLDAFAVEMQNHFEEIVSGAGEYTPAFLVNVQNAASGNSELRNACTDL